MKYTVQIERCRVGKYIFRRWVRVLLIILQTFGAGLLMYCVLNAGFWMEDSYSFSELSRSYESTELFFRQVDTILEHKIRGQQNQELFEDGGELNLQKGIDIQSYGDEKNTIQDMNTTYILEDLLKFCERGDCQALQTAIQNALTQQKETHTDAGELLGAQSAGLETITPVTGISLAECSQWYSDSAEYVLRQYTLLADTASDIYSRYQEYTQVQDESWSQYAPSNLIYCIEDASARKLYTNSGAFSYLEAVKRIQEDESYVTLFEGERSYNIMVANPDHVLNDTAGDWFMSERYVSANEKIYLAVDQTYPVSDILQIYAGYFARRETIVWASVIAAVVGLAVMCTGFVLSVMAAGWKEGRCTPVLLKIDRVPTEIAAGFYGIIGLLYLLYLSRWHKTPQDIYDAERIVVSAIAAGMYLIFLSGCLGLTRRIRTRTLWTNSVSYLIVLTWKRVYAARAASGQLLILYIVFFVLNFLLLLFCGEVGIILIIMLDMVVLLFLLRDMAGKQSIWEGIHQISQGDLKYKIDTTAMQGETLEMAKAVNEMGDGLQEALDAILKNERLKAELITNVSHDLKTPLTSIVNYVDLLKREHLEGERVQHYIEVLEQKSGRLKQLTEDLVEASKISSGNVEVQMMRMQLQSMIQQAYGEFQERLEERGLTAEWTMDKEPICIMADGRHLWRVLENLLGNIYKYAMEQTRIYIEVKKEGQNAVLSLKNTSQEKLTIDAEELTGRFVRGDKSRNTEGSGLGLSIAQSLTEIQGGTFRLTVDGDLFKAVITFPVAEETDTE